MNYYISLWNFSWDGENLCYFFHRFQIQEVSSSPFLECVWLQGSNIGTAQCGEYKFCICEKMVDPAVIEQVNYLDRQ